MSINKIKNILLTITIISTLILGYLYLSMDKEVVEVPITIEVPVPGKTGTFKPFPLPKPKKVLPRPIPKDSLLKDSILKERHYEQTFEDDNIKATVKSKVLGVLEEQSLDYIIKPDTISVDTILPIKIPNKPTLLFNMNSGIPLTSEMKIPLEAGFSFIPKEKNLGYNVSYDINNKVIKGGISIKF